MFSFSKQKREEKKKEQKKFEICLSFSRECEGGKSNIIKQQQQQQVEVEMEVGVMWGMNDCLFNKDGKWLKKFHPFCSVREILISFRQFFLIFFFASTSSRHTTNSSMAVTCQNWNLSLHFRVCVCVCELDLCDRMNENCELAQNLPYLSLCYVFFQMKFMFIVDNSLSMSPS